MPTFNVIFPDISSSGPVVVPLSNGTNTSRNLALLLAAADSGGQLQLLQDLALADSTPVKFTSDPPTMVVILVWASGDDLNPNNTFMQADYFGGGWGSAQCDMELFNLTIRRDITGSGTNQASGDYSLEQAPTRNEGSFVATMWSPLLSQRANARFALNIYVCLYIPFCDEREVTASQSNGDFQQSNITLVMAHVSQQLSRAALGMFAGTLKPVPVTAIIEEVILGRYPVAPVLTYVGLLVVYSLIALGIFLWATLLKTPGVTMPGINGKTATVLQLAQVQLTDPLIVVAQSFERELKCSEEKRIETSEVGGTESRTEEGVIDEVNETNQEEGATAENEEASEVEGKGLTNDYVRTEPSIATDGLDLFQEDQYTKRLAFSLGSRGLRLRVREYRPKEAS
ncbi:hypothetical protein BDN72DRAFT_940293 [Pluteus cervinus]|uniref:Uncharacterized protein n=1 Tax=Pluteus cervinus TaxID=181527 RepID=A0ACD3A3Y1_9AGAR|nr:hypothetical protein BDN72DRAFT_940293 [Pluteus cervinus]